MSSSSRAHTRSADHPHTVTHRPASNVNPTSGSSTPVVTNVNCSVASELPPSVMPTVMLKVSYGNVNKQARALIDSGSQRSFISTSLARELQLPVIATVKIRLATFGSDFSEQELPIVKAKVQIGKRRFTAKFLVYDQINTEISCPGIRKLSETLKSKNVRLADNKIHSDVLTNIELLIGVDYFSKLIQSQRRVLGVSMFVTPAGVIPFGSLPEWTKPVIDRCQ